MVVKTSQEKFKILERPIVDKKDDFFDIKTRLVDKLHNIIDSNSQLTIAITGEYGIGKSSVMSLLYNELKNNSKNIILKFDPILNGKEDIAEIIKYFYLKLSNALKDSTIKDFVRKSLKSLAILTKADIEGNIEFNGGTAAMPVSAGAKININVGEKVDALLDLWEKEKPDDFSDQIVNLNKLLNKKNIKLCIFIDEIDRLPAKHIVNFLIFSRILESLDQMVCIVGIDYEKVIYKLQNENFCGLNNYEQAVDYLDKLFQMKFTVHHNRYKKIDYAISVIEKIDYENILKEILENNDQNIKNKLGEIIDYLSTPRQIKKWLLSIQAHYSIIKHSHTYKINFLAFIAATIKHPILLDHLSKNTITLLNNKSYLKQHIKETHDVDFSDHKDVDRDILAASMGVSSCKLGTDSSNNSNFNESIKKLIKNLKKQEIDDKLTSLYIKDYLKTPAFLITLFIEGFVNEDQVSRFAKFFGDDINNVLSWLITETKDPKTDILVSDFAELLHKGTLSINGNPNIELLNKLWSEKIHDNDFINPYISLILFALRNCPVENSINESCLGLSEIHITSILDVYGIKNIDYGYDFNHFQEFSERLRIRGMHNLKYKGTAKFNRNTLQQIVNQWIDKVELDLRSQEPQVYNQARLISVFYRYIQLGLAINSENDLRDRLASYLIKFLSNKNIPEAQKKYIRESIKKERGQFANKTFGGRKEDPIFFLFNNNPTLVELFKL